MSRRRLGASIAATLLLVAASIRVASAQSPSPGPEGASPAPSPPPPTPVILPGGRTTLSPFPSTLRTPEPSRQPPEIGAATAVLADLDTGQVLFELAGRERRPIASLTKMMTALIVVERTRLTDVVTVSEEAASGLAPGISGLGLEAGERIRVHELLYALLLQSANDAAYALAEHVAGSVDAFVRQMNVRARRLGMTGTRFASPNGLDDTGYSTARDLLTLTRAAYGVRGFASVVATRVHTIESPDATPRTVQNRNALLWLYPGALGVKTGFTTPAGFCLVATAERDDLRLVAVVLGEPGEPFSDAAALLNHGFEAFERRTIVREGDPLGPIEIAGREVAVVSGGTLESLVRVGIEVTREIVLDEPVPYPPARGETIGTARFEAGGDVVGRVPLVVAGLPPPPPPEEGSWWGRALGAVLEAAGAALGALLG